MNEITQQREYYKISTGLEQNDGSIDLNLFYNTSTVEVKLLKDTTTSIHFSFFATPVLFKECGLIEAGATAGPVPAVADRIYTSQRGYGNRTFWDETEYPQSGGWHYTWLYDNKGNTPVWMDRYYNPGSLSSQNDIISEYNKSIYIYGSDDFFIDIPSNRSFEPKGYYEYVHIGSKLYNDQINLLSGIQLSGLGLHYSNWADGSIDLSPYSNILRVRGNTEGMLDNTDTSISDSAFLNLSTTNPVDFRIDFNESYLTDRHFTTMAWVKAQDWDSINTSQILGNISTGGYGLFYEAYKNTPYFVYGDTKRNILFFINNNFENYETIETQSTYGVSITYYGLDSKNGVFVLDNIKKTITRFDHTGNAPIAQLELQTTNTLYRIFFDINDNIYITTSKSIIKVDNNLLEILENINHISDEKTFIVFNADNTRIIKDNINDIKIIKNKLIYINHINELIYEDIVLASNVNCFELDPDDYVWCVYNFNKIAKIDIATKTILLSKKIEPENTVFTKKSISIIQKYNRNTANHTWYICVLTNNSKSIYQINSDGSVLKSIHLPYQIGQITNNILDEDINIIASYNTTSYTCNRIKLNNLQPRLEFRLCMKKVNTENINIAPYQFKTYTLGIDRNKLLDNTWHHICLIFNNNLVEFYLDTILVDKIIIPENFIMSYDGVNSFHIGDFSGRYSSISDEIKINDLTFNGCIDELRVYRYSIEPYFLTLFRRSYLKSKDLIWNMSTSKFHQSETIQGIFKNKLPGSISNYFNLKISGIDLSNLSTTDAERVKDIVDAYIRKVIENSKPTTSELLNIEWL